MHLSIFFNVEINFILIFFPTFSFSLSSLSNALRLKIFGLFNFNRLYFHNQPFLFLFSFSSPVNRLVREEVVWKRNHLEKAWSWIRL